MGQGSSGQCHGRGRWVRSWHVGDALASLLISNFYAIPASLTTCRDVEAQAGTRSNAKARNRGTRIREARQNKDYDKMSIERTTCRLKSKLRHASQEG